jgi:hypothetical protein
LQSHIIGPYINENIKHLFLEGVDLVVVERPVHYAQQHVWVRPLLFLIINVRTVFSSGYPMKFFWKPFSVMAY